MQSVVDERCWWGLTAAASTALPISMQASTVTCVRLLLTQMCSNAAACRVGRCWSVTRFLQHDPPCRLLKQGYIYNYPSAPKARARKSAQVHARCRCSEISCPNRMFSILFST
jgi:hypothetical protein